MFENPFCTDDLLHKDTFRAQTREIHSLVSFNRQLYNIHTTFSIYEKEKCHVLGPVEPHTKKKQHGVLTTQNRHNTKRKKDVHLHHLFDLTR